MVTQRLSRSAHDKMIGGVCGGLGRYFGIDPVFVRLIMIALIFAGGISLLIYPILWLVMPLEGMPQATLGANLHEIRREAETIGQQTVQQVQAMFSAPHDDPQTGTSSQIDLARRNRMLGVLMAGIGITMLASYFGGAEIVMALMILGGGIYLLRQAK